jgi:phytoene dehydrogenase-like protein
MERDITIIGGGLAGLVAAITCAEAGAAVRLREASRVLGGRARTASGPFKANLGPHALYSDGEAWQWLRRRDLLPEIAHPPNSGLRLRHEGRLRRLPPAGIVRALLHRGLQAPPDAAFRTWARERMDERTVDALCGMAGVFAFDADPGRLSAAFVWERLLRVTTLPAVARYPVGGWTSLVARLEHAARRLGVEISTGDRVTALPEPPVIVATDLPAAAALLGDATLDWTGSHTLLLDLGLRRRQGDPFIVSDLDEAGWIERFTASDPSLAPAGHELVQAQIGIRPGESADNACARLEQLADTALEGWRERVVWRRRQVMHACSGALDLPGTTWRDRPAVDRGGGVFLCGDMVAAPGLLGEVSFASAVEAGRRAGSWIADPGLVVHGR